MTRNKRTLYHFGTICGLVGKDGAEIQAHPETRLAKRVDSHIAHLGGGWQNLIAGALTPGQKHALSFGQAQGIKAREALATTLNCESRVSIKGV